LHDTVNIRETVFTHSYKFNLRSFQVVFSLVCKIFSVKVYLIVED